MYVNERLQFFTVPLIIVILGGDLGESAKVWVHDELIILSWLLIFSCSYKRNKSSNNSLMIGLNSRFLALNVQPHQFSVRKQRIARRFL